MLGKPVIQPSIPAKLTLIIASTSHSSVTGILLRETSQTSTLSTPFPSTLFMAPSAQQVQTALSTSGIKMPSTDSKAIPQQVVLYQRRILIGQGIFLHMQSAMTGARDT
jgi:hypothetical protein